MWCGWGTAAGTATAIAIASAIAKARALVHIHMYWKTLLDVVAIAVGSSWAAKKWRKRRSVSPIDREFY